MTNLLLVSLFLLFEVERIGGKEQFFSVLQPSYKNNDLMFKRFTSPLGESARWVANPLFIYKVLIYTNCERSWIALKNTPPPFLPFFLLLKVNQVNTGIYSCSTHWAQSQYLFLCLWGTEARAAVVQTIIICAGSKKSHVSQFMSAAVAPSHDWFRIWNKLRNHFLFLCGHSSLFSRHPDTYSLLPVKLTRPAGTK